MKIKNKTISVVVPVFNEIGNIKQFHEELLTVLQQMERPYEVIYVDDRSDDGTFEYLEKVSNVPEVSKASIFGDANDHKLRYLHQPVHQSYGRMHSGPHRRNALISHQVIKSSPYVKDFGGTQSGHQVLEDFRREDLMIHEVMVFRKSGKPGKAFSLVEGFDRAQGSTLVMIDGDLQYTPSKIPDMVEKLQHADVVVANRKQYKDSFVRKFLSSGFRNVFGKMLFGLSTDIQSGLKVFKRDVYETVKFTPFSPWTFDLEFLSRAVQAGFAIKNVDIAFNPRFEGKSKVSIFKTPFEIGYNAIRTKLRQVPYFPIAAEDRMRGAGVGFKKKKYITHTSLPLSLSAVRTFSVGQRVTLITFLLGLIASFVLLPLKTAQVVAAVLSILYFIDTVFNLLIVLRSLQKEGEIKVSDGELRSLDEVMLPMYTILCPLYKEAHVVPQFLEAISKLDWPKDKLDVMFLLEEDDTETIEAFSEMTLPYYARTVVVPHSMPKTKPKACNYGLTFARGEYLVIYDAEDIPDIMQLKKAYVAFQKVPKDVACLQAKLNFYNTNQNLLTRFFTAEYSLWFDVTLVGLQSLRSTIPLGGTSNHFKTQTLLDLQGWDPFNVTEDADLGIRLFQKGYQTAIIDSTTLEEATSKANNWLRQRSRWIKGYMQTYLVHMRNIRQFTKEKGIMHNLIFQMTVGGKILFILLNPFMWVLTLLYFTAYPLVGPTLEAIYVPPVSYIAVTSWIFGNFLFLYYYMIGTGKRQQWDVTKYVLLIPAYWGMLSTAAAVAFYQLLFKPHYWEKTVHGFHLGKGPKAAKGPEGPKVRPVVEPIVQPVYQPSYINSNIEYRISKQYQNANKVNTKHFEFLNFRNFNLLRISNFGFRVSSWFRAFPLVLLFSLDIIAGFALTPDNAQRYIMVSLLAKIVVLVLQADNKHFIVFERNLQSIVNLFKRSSASTEPKRMRILIFNWRDTKHAYAGGAEVYVHELAKRWVNDGNSVTLFSGNDTKSLSEEYVDGVHVVRRGGTYTVYFFAMLYYLFKFRGNYDVIVDCENGIPFFSPLFARIPSVLLIHHVHQEVFHNFLRFPLNYIAQFLEGTIMPFVYKNRAVVTVSESSRQEIFKLGFTDLGNISIIPNGVSSSLTVTYPKTEDPSFVYLGRLKEYKNIDVAIKAFAQVLKTYQQAKLAIVGSGEMDGRLAALVRELQIEHAVTFYGKVSEQAKMQLLSQSWAALQPSQIEGWGITVIEANAVGTPVIASRVSGLKDSVMDGVSGMLVKVGSSHQFARAMTSIIADEELRMRLSQGAMTWARNFDWDKSSEHFYLLLVRNFAQSLYGKPRYGNIFDSLLRFVPKI